MIHIIYFNIFPAVIVSNCLPTVFKQFYNRTSNRRAVVAGKVKVKVSLALNNETQIHEDVCEVKLKLYHS
jgi:F0F1-type ATP synthase membrane subunit a